MAVVPGIGAGSLGTGLSGLAEWLEVPGAVLFVIVLVWAVPGIFQVDVVAPPARRRDPGKPRGRRSARTRRRS